MDAIREHEEKLLAAFGKVLVAEEQLASATTQLEETTAIMSRAKSEAETILATAWGEVASMLNETGEVEVLLPGSVTDFKVGWSIPRESIRAVPEATPDEYCKIERKPKLKEIGDHLRGLRKRGLPLPNWASFHSGEPKLGWKAVKKLTNKQKE